MVGIVGPTGSGKSTVVSLIPRFRDPDAGRITIDGVDICDYKLHGLRCQIGFVLQDTVLLRGTVRDNIAFGRPDATEDEIVEAAKLANADEFIIRMPDGYDSLVGDRGSDPVRRPATAHRDRAGAYPRQPDPHPRRADRRAGRRVRGVGDRGDGAADGGPDGHHDRPSPEHAAQTPTRSSSSKTAWSPKTARTRSCWHSTGSTRTCTICSSTRRPKPTDGGSVTPLCERQ